MNIKTLFAFLCMGALLVVGAQQSAPPPTTPTPPLFKGDKPKKNDGTRSVAGVVRDPSDNLANNVVVKLKDMKTLAIRSFITKENGAFSFQGLSAGVDYELKAETREGTASPTKVLSVFDNRREAVVNLKLDEKK